MRYTGMMRDSILACNWKMNPGRRHETETLYQGLVAASKALKASEIWIAPPTPFIDGLRERRIFKRLSLGAQDCSRFTMGAHTGEVSAAMLKEAGAQFVIVGHSERRAMGESDTDVNTKVQYALKARITVLLCVGEKLRDGDGEYLAVIASQVRSALMGVPKSASCRLVIAYEPVWAIGEHAAAPATPEDFRSVSIYIKKVVSEQVGAGAALSVPVLYGGSVSKDNAMGFLDEGHADGLLIGRESLKLSAMKTIIADAEALGRARVQRSRKHERTR